MKHLQLTGMFSLIVLCMTALADRPAVQFDAGEITFAKAASTTPVVWMGMVEGYKDHRAVIRTLRGVAAIGSARVAATLPDGLSHDRGIWLFAGLDGSYAFAQAGPAFSAAVRTVDVIAEVGSASVAIVASRAEVTYVRDGAMWQFSAADGGKSDADLQADGRITMVLPALQPLEDGPAAPSAVAANDVILVIDVTNWRASALEVQP